MNIPVIAAMLMATALLSGADSQAPVKLAPCAGHGTTGRHIVSQMEIVEFSVPLFASMKKASDVDYVEYFVRYGPERDKIWLRFMFGIHAGAGSPRDLGNGSIQWATHEWGCNQGVDGKDWSGVSADGRRWRHISIPFGFAAYSGVSPKAAAYFDRILNTMCCGRCPLCK